MLANTTDYLETLDQIKRDIAETRSRAVRAVNTELIGMYWRIGKEINEHLDWGKGFIPALSKDIRQAYPGIKGFSERSLGYMAKFAREVDKEFLQQSAAKIPWGHIMLLLDKTVPGPRRDWYIAASFENGWSRAVLDHQIDLRAYERPMSESKSSNFSRTLPDSQSEMMQQVLKDPYIFDFITAEQTREPLFQEDPWS